MIVDELAAAGVPFSVIRYRVDCPFFPGENASMYEIIAPRGHSLARWGFAPIYDPARYRARYLHRVLTSTESARFRARRLQPSLRNAWGECWEFNGGCPRYVRPRRCGQ